MKKIVSVLVITLLASFMFAALPKPYFFPITVEGVPIADYTDLNVSFYITARPGEVSTTYIQAPSMPFGNSIQINLSNFPTQWGAGETIHMDLEQNGLTATHEQVIADNTGNPVFPPATPTIDLTGGVTPDPGEGEGNNTGEPSVPVNVDVEPVDVDGDTVNPDVTLVDNAGVQAYTVFVHVDGEPTNLVENIVNTLLAYDLDLTGTVAGISIHVVLSFDGYTGIDDVDGMPYIYVYGISNGYAPYATWPNWFVPENIMWDFVGNTVSFDIVFAADAKDNSTEIILGDRKGASGDPLADGDPLPVTLTAFNAAYVQGEFVKLLWTAESESELAGYKVYRSEESINEALPVSGLIEAENTSETHTYIFKDAEVEANMTYNYWLEIINLDGTSRFFDQNITVTTEGDVSSVVEATMLKGNYPNPFNPSTTIAFDVKNGENASLTIYNAKGQVVEVTSWTEGHHDYAWNAARVGSGIYFYKLKSDSYSEVKKMIMIK